MQYRDRLIDKDQDDSSGGWRLGGRGVEQTKKRVKEKTYGNGQQRGDCQGREARKRLRRSAGG